MILVDSGPLIAAATEDDQDHRRCVDLFASLHLISEKLLVPQTVVAEVAYSIQKLGGTEQELLFLRSLADGDLALVDLVAEDMPRSSSLSRPTGTSRSAQPTPRSSPSLNDSTSPRSRRSTIGTSPTCDRATPSI